jgi:hypothetical protein
MRIEIDDPRIKRFRKKLREMFTIVNEEVRLRQRAYRPVNEKDLEIFGILILDALLPKEDK